MKITMSTDELDGGVRIVCESYGLSNNDLERVVARGSNLTEAVENLVLRFKALQDAAIDAMYEHGIVRAPRDAARKKAEGAS